jgi:hypothetical protein
MPGINCASNATSAKDLNSYQKYMMNIREQAEQAGAKEEQEPVKHSYSS